MLGGKGALHSGCITGTNVLLLTGTSGFILGAITNGTWQLAVESVQVISGVVQYPRDNAFYWYHTKAWTLLHQFFVPFVWLGVPEKTISYLLSGIIGMLSFQALAMTAWTVSKDAILSIASPFVVLFGNATRFFTVYPVVMMSTSNTHGAIGLSLFLLVIALISNRSYKSGLFLLGLLPAIHLSISVLCWVIFVSYFLSNSPGFRNEFRTNAKFLLIGLVITATSLLIQYLLIYDVPAIEETVTLPYFHTFLRYWDSHRGAVQWNRPGIYVNMAVLIASMIWLTRFKRYIAPDVKFLLFSFVIAATTGFIFAAVSWAPPEKVPSSLMMIMPTRILEINQFAVVAFMLGLYGLFRKDFVPQLLLGIFLTWTMYHQDISWKVALAFLALSLSLPIFRRPKYSYRSGWRFAQLRWFTVMLLVVIVASTIVYSPLFRPDAEEWRLYNLRDHANHDYFQSVSSRSGMLVTAADLHLIQLRTRRPVLLDGGQLDLLPYLKESGPQMDRILQEVYGLDFFAPPEQALRTACIPKLPVKKAWESRSREEWEEIRKLFGVTEVLTYSDWKLALPLIGKSRDFASYSIPH